MADFSAILKKQKRDFQGEKKKVQVSEAAQEYVLKQQVEQGYTPKGLKEKGIGKGAQKIVKSFEQAVFQISDVESYADFADFIKQWKMTVAQTKQGKRFDKVEQMYIDDVLGDTLKHLTSLGGVALRGTFVAESFMKQFKPMNLLAMLTRGWPIIGGIVQRKIRAKELSDATIRQAVYETSKEKKTTELSGLRGKLEGLDQPEEGPSKQVAKIGDRGSDVGQEDQAKPEVKRKELFVTKKNIEKPLATKMAGSAVGGKLGDARQEEKFEETEEERMDLFKKIEKHTKATAEALGAKMGGGKKIGGFLGNLKRGNILAALGLTAVAGSLMRGLGAVIFNPITYLIAGTIWAIMDGIKGSKAFGGVPGFIGGFLGGLDTGIAGMFKGMGKWGMIGAGIGSMFVPGIGTLVGGLIGLLVGGILGWIGGERITAFIKEMTELVSSMWTDMIEKLKETKDSIKKSIKSYPGKIAKVVSDIFKPIFDTLAAMVLAGKKAINFLIIGYNKLPFVDDMKLLDVSTIKQEGGDASIAERIAAEDRVQSSSALIKSKVSRFVDVNQASADAKFVDDYNYPINMALDNRSNFATSNNQHLWPSLRNIDTEGTMLALRKE